MYFPSFPIEVMPSSADYADRVRVSSGSTQGSARLSMQWLILCSSALLGGKIPSIDVSLP